MATAEDNAGDEAVTEEASSEEGTAECLSAEKAAITESAKDQNGLEVAEAETIGCPAFRPSDETKTNQATAVRAAE